MKKQNHYAKYYESNLVGSRWSSTQTIPWFYDLEILYALNYIKLNFLGDVLSGPCSPLSNIAYTLKTSC